jgi:trehalose-6-phosphate synthase
LPFIIEKKENPNNEIILNISETSNNLNIKYNQTLYDDKLINLILYSLKTMNVCEVYWVGILRGLDEYPEKYQYEICEYLESQKIYAVMPHKKDFINFQIYINKILYPLYNNLEIDINSHFYQNQDNYYIGYLNVNKSFADTIHSCSNDNLRMIFINDIDLAFVPSYLLTKNLGANICLFLHTNFPDYNILTLMQANREIIKSLLLCNTL